MIDNIVKLLFVTLCFRDIFEIKIMGLSLRISDIFIIIFNILFFLNYKRYKKGISKILKHGISIYLLVSVVLIVKSLIYTGNIDNLVFREIFGMIMYITAFIGLYIYLINTNSIKIETLIKIVIVSNLIIIIIYSIDYFFNIFGISKEYEVMFGIRLRRFKAATSEPAYFVNLIIFPLSLLIVTYINNVKFIKNQIWIMIVFIFACIITFSTIGYCIMIGILFTTILIKNNMKKYYKRNFLNLILLCIITITLLVISNINIKLTNNNLFNNIVSKVYSKDVDYSSIQRYDWRTAAINMFKEKPIIGHGIGSYYLNQKKYAYLRTNTIAKDANCLYLLYASERGSVGLISLLFLFEGMIRFGIIAIKVSSNKKNKLFAYSMVIALICYFIHYFVIGYLWIYYFWIYLSLICAYFHKVVRRVDHENINN